jgi:hypothetical protein
LGNRITLREHATADPITRFENGDPKTGADQFGGGRKSGRACANHDDIRELRHK